MRELMKMTLCFALLMIAVCAACTDECMRETTLLDPGWEQKWKDQNDGIARWYWCECHTGQPLTPSVMYGMGPSPIRNLEDKFPWGLGQWVKIDTADYRLVSSSDTPADLAKKDFEWRAAAVANCSTRAACYDLLRMTPKACGDLPEGAEVIDGGTPGTIPPGTTPPGTGASSSGDYP